MKITIKARLTDAVKFEGEYESTKHACESNKSNLSGANLYGANLSGADLRGADLSGADLSGADLYGANLRGADLYGADLRGANLRGADLYGADLRGADLRGADLYGADNKVIGKIKSVLQIGPIGSRKDYTIAIEVDAGIYINAGCFFGTLKEFTDKVKATHKSGRYAIEYKSAIAMIKATFKARGGDNA